MIVGFLGKGGSGKSTLASLYTNFLLSKNKSVLAIDADHNMDFSYNLGITEDSFPYFGSTGTTFLLRHFGYDEDGPTESAPITAVSHVVSSRVYSDLFRQKLVPSFSFNKNNMDLFTRTFGKQIRDNLLCMSSGPHDEVILHGNKCSHSLGTPLKVYLPLLELSSDEHVVVDMIASNDAAATSIPTGFTYALVSVEPTPHSIKAAKQIHDTLVFFGVPHGYVLNKSRDIQKDSEMIKEQLGEEPVSVVPSDARISSPSFHGDHTQLSDELSDSMNHIYRHIQSYVQTHGDARKVRSSEKMARNKLYKETVLRG